MVYILLRILVSCNPHECVFKIIMIKFVFFNFQKFAASYKHIKQFSNGIHLSLKKLNKNYQPAITFGRNFYQTILSTVVP